MKKPKNPTLWWYEDRQQWVADLTEPDSGKRRRWYSHTGDERRAQQLFHLYLARLYGAAVHQSPDNLTVGQLAEMWFDWNEANRAPNTGRSRRVYLRWLLDRYADLYVGELSMTHIERVKAAKRRSNLARSVNHFVNAVKGLFFWAVRQGLLEDNPMRHLSRVPREAPRRRAQSAEALALALPAADKHPPLGDFMRLMLFTGMRAGEAAGVRWADYDPKRGTVYVERHKTVGYAGKPKLLPLSSHAQAIIERQPRHGRHVWAREDGSRITANALYQRLKRLRDAEDVSAEARAALRQMDFHAMRHTFASRLGAANVHPKVAMNLLGHQTPLMTLYYTDLDEEQMRAAAEKAGG